MLTFEVINELTLKVTCRGNDVLFTKAGSFICGENGGQKNYKFEKLLLGPQQNAGQALLGSLMRRVTGENLPLMKVMMNGDSITYYANHAQHVVVYQLQPGEVLSIESEIFSPSPRTANTMCASSAVASSPRKDLPPPH